jgi:hypothetical protein
MADERVRALEAEVRRRFGKSAPGLLFSVPVDLAARSRAFVRLLGEPEPTDLETDAQQEVTCHE